MVTQKSSLTFHTRKNTPIYKMLDQLNNANCPKPKRPSNCIIIDLNFDLEKVDATFFDTRINAFIKCIEDFYWIDTKLVGMEGPHIRVFIEPEPYSEESRKIVYDEINIGLFQREMMKSQITRAFFYGHTLVIT